MPIVPIQDGVKGLAPIEALPLVGSVPNKPHQTSHGFMTGAPYELAIVEFDDQGRCHDPGQMEGVAARLDDLVAEKKDVILLVFVHGWKHDARTDDPNLSEFCNILGGAVRREAEAPGGEGARQVLGIFVGWRGLSEFAAIDAVADATFWGRQAAGQRVATGSVRELFGRLRHYCNHRRDLDGAPLLVIAGHSFGGMIVYSALAQSLIEAASPSVGDIEPRFADLVLLINPAIEAARYLPIHDLVIRPGFRDRANEQAPVFICAQAENDQPVGTWFPVGNTYHRLDSATIGDLEKDCLTHAFGFVPAFRTHTLHGPAANRDFVLELVEGRAATPFWMIGAAKEVIDGHGGIWLKPFRDFLASILFQHIQESKAP